jgi:small multidrug resistance family-3 protein
VKSQGATRFFGWLRLGKSAWWLVPGALGLAAFAWLLTMHPFQNAGRVYAAYGGVYIVASLLWLWMAERQSISRNRATRASVRSACAAR